MLPRSGTPKEVGRGTPASSTPPARSELDEFVATAPVGMHGIALDGAVLWANAALLDLLGYAHEEYVGRSIADFCTDPLRFHTILTEIVERGGADRCPATLRAKDGSPRHVLISARRVDHGPRAPYLRCFVMDVSDRQRVEEELRASRAGLELIADFSRALAEAGLDEAKIVRHLAEHVGGRLADRAVVRTRVASGELSTVAAEPAGAQTGPDDEALERAALAVRDVLVREGPGRGARLAAPLVCGDEILGVLLASRATRSFSADDARLAGKLASRTALALGGAREHAALVRERQRLDAVLRQMPSAVVLVDAATHAIELANEQNATIFRRSLDDLRYVEDRFLGYDSSGRMLRVEDWPIPRALEKGEIVRGEELRIVRHDGTQAQIRVNAGPVRDENGAIVAAIATYDDVTEQRRANERLEFLGEASTLLASSIDFDATLRSVCTLAVPLLADWCAIEVLHSDGSHEQLAVAHVDPAKIEYAWELRRRYPPDVARDDVVLRVLRTGRMEIYREIPDEMLVASAIDEEHLRISRELGLKSAIVVPMKTRTRVFGAMTLVMAESDRRFGDADVRLAEELAWRAALAIENATLYKEAQRAVELRDDFLSIASHELRTPLAALELQVAGLVRALDLGRIGPADGTTLRERLVRAHAQVGRLTTLITQLLEVSRIDAGRLALDYGDVDLGALALEVCGRFEEQSARTGTPLSIQVTDPVVGRWDRNRLDQVLTNLVSNALKYGAGQPVELHVDHVEDLARVRVCDRGLGIAPSDHARIFERFERTAAAKQHGGIGLGLWIARQIVEAHGGTIAVESDEGQGAAFTVVLPLAAADEG